MRHPHIDLRTVFGSHVADGTRAVMIEHQGEFLERLHPVAEKASRAYARSPAALVRRQLVKSETAFRGRRIVPGAKESDDDWS